MILEQYPHDVNNRRMLYIDRLKREFPHKTRNEIVGVLEWAIVRYKHLKTITVRSTYIFVFLFTGRT